MIRIRTAILACFLVSAAGFPVVAQDPGAIDFSEAHISVAGPASFYVRGLEVDGDRLSVLVRPSADGVWEVDRVVAENENIVPPQTVLDLASVRRIDERTVEVDGIVIGEEVYSGRLRIGDDLSVRPVTAFGEGNPESVNEQRASGLAAAGLGLRPELDRLEREAGRLEETVSDLRTENEFLRGEVERLTARVNELETGGAAEITSRLESLSQQLAEVEARLSEEIAAAGETAGAAEPGAGGAGAASGDGSDADEELRRRIAELELRNAELRAEKLELQDRILAEIAGGGLVGMMGPRLRSTILDDFSEARVQLGEWRLDGRSAVQTDPEQYFAKLMLPAPQRTRPTLYRFSARAADDGWVGLGLHLFVEETGRTGYGLGRSLLVWFTRDPEVYGTQHTYLQVYRSDDDVNMARVADALIAEPIDEELDIEILFEPATDYITIAVNGRDKLRYRTWFGIDEGTGVALRSLGRADFRNLSVRTSE